MRAGRMLAFAGAAAAVLCAFAGCGKNSDVFSKYLLDAPAPPGAGLTADLYEQEYLSENVCVAPASARLGKDGNVEADAALLINATDCEAVFSKNAYKRMYPASVTKIVTALVALKYGNLDDVAVVSYNASHITEYGAKLCGFEEGDRIRLRKLLYALMVYSGNDAGVAVAEHVAGSVEEFAKLMNAEMKEIGAIGSHFVNPHGLHDDGHYTTAYDLYLAFNKLLSDYPEFVDIIDRGGVKVSYKSAGGEKKTVRFTSTVKYKIDGDDAGAPKGVDIIGGKTGTTQKAGSNLILYSKGPDGDSYISVVMHAKDSFALYDQMNYLLSLEGADGERESTS